MGVLRRWFRRFRDAITGRFVSKAYAEQNPATTVGEKADPADLASELKRKAGL